MYIDNIDYQMSYIRSDEAGEFIAYLVDKDVKGAINGKPLVMSMVSVCWWCTTRERWSPLTALI